MKKETSALTAFFICLVLAFSAASARAEAISTSEAWINWTSLTITEGDISWLFDKGSESYGWAEDDTGWDEDSQQEAGWVDTDAFASIHHSASGASGQAYTDNLKLYEGVDAIADGNPAIWSSSNAKAWRWGDFVADSTGWVTFSADYSLSQNLSTENIDESASGLAEAGLSLMNEYDMYPTEDIATLYNEVSDGSSISDSDAGILEVSVYFYAGDTGYFEAWVYNEAAAEIPEPATVALLGLGTLALLRKRRA